MKMGAEKAGERLCGIDNFHQGPKITPCSLKSHCGHFSALRKGKFGSRSGFPRAAAANANTRAKALSAKQEAEEGLEAMKSRIEVEDSEKSIHQALNLLKESRDAAVACTVLVALMELDAKGAKNLDPAKVLEALEKLPSHSEELWYTENLAEFQFGGEVYLAGYTSSPRLDHQLLACLLGAMEGDEGEQSLVNRAMWSDAGHNESLFSRVFGMEPWEVAERFAQVRRAASLREINLAKIRHGKAQENLSTK